MEDKEIKISNFGLFVTIIVTSIGVNVFSYPSELATFLGTDGWMAIIVNTVIAFIIIWLINTVIKNNNYKQCYEIFTGSFGKIIGNIACLSLVVYALFSVSTGLRVLGEEIKVYLLERTPLEFIFLITILSSVYLVRGGIDNILRFNQICFWLMFIPIFIVFMFATYGIDFSNLLPVFVNKPLDYFKASVTGVHRYGGLEILFFIIPFVMHKKNVNKVGLKSVIFIGIFYILTFILTIARFGTKGTKDLLWPTITMIKNISIPASFIERWEGVVMSIWILFYMTTLVNLYYFAAYLIQNIFNLKHIKLSSAIIMPFIYLIALYPSNIAQLVQITGKYTLTLFIINLIIIPILLCIISCIRKKAGGNNIE